MDLGNVQTAVQTAVQSAVQTAVQAALSYWVGALSEPVLGSVNWLLADNCGGNLVPAPVIAETLGNNGI